MVGVQLVPLSGFLPGAQGRMVDGVLRADAADSPFVAGEENQLVATAIAGVLNQPGVSFNPLVLYGPPGVGKSHLAAGLVEAWQQQHPTCAVHTNGSDFARGYSQAVDSEAVDHSAISAWRAPLRSAGLLVLENLMQMSSKRGALQELISALDERISLRRPVVITSRLPPSEIRGLPTALVGRLAGGLLLAVSPPGLESRRLLVESMARARRLKIEPAALRILADAFPATVPEIHAAMCELQMSVDGTQDASAARDNVLGITAATVKKFVGRRLVDVRPSVRSITTLTAKYFGLKTAELTSPSRRRAVVTARGVALYLARQLTGKSLEQLGAHFGGRDHTTVLHSYRSTDLKQQRDPDVRRAIDELRKLIAAS